MADMDAGKNDEALPVAGLKKIGKALSIPFDALERQIQTETTYIGSRGNIEKHIVGIAKALPKFAGNINEIMLGSLEIVSACSQLMPVGGPCVRNIAYLASTVLGSMGGCKSNISKIVSDVISDAFRKCDDTELEREAAGVAKDFAVSQAFLQGMQTEIGNIKGWEIAAMSAHVPISKGVPFLTKLTRIIKELAATPALTFSPEKEQIQPLERILQYTQLYCHLATLRDAVLWNMYAISVSAEDTEAVAKGIENVIKLEQSHDKDALGFLLTPGDEHAVVKSFFNPEIWSFVYMFLGQRKLSRSLITKEIERKSVAMRVMKWMDWHVSCSTGDSFLYLLRDKKYVRMVKGPLEENGLFYFSRKYNDVYYNISIFGRKGSYLKMSEDGQWLIIDEVLPGPEGEWRTIRLKEGRYVLSTKKWPLRFLTSLAMTTHHCLSLSMGYPGPNGEWMIECSQEGK